MREKVWQDWCGHGNPPVQVGDRLKVRFRDGDESTTTSSTPLRWSHIGCLSDIVAYQILEGAARGTVVSDGGSSDYYKLTIKNKAGEALSCEMGDIIRAVVNNDFDLGNVLKAARRMSLAAQGVGKEGTSVSYDANKIKWFADEFAFWHEVF